MITQLSKYQIEMMVTRKLRTSVAVEHSTENPKNMRIHLLFIILAFLYFPAAFFCNECIHSYYISRYDDKGRNSYPTSTSNIDIKNANKLEFAEIKFIQPFLISRKTRRM